MRESGKRNRVSEVTFLRLVYERSEVTDRRSRLGGEILSVLAIRLKVRGFKPGRGDGFLRAIKSAAHLPS
jgi:hypothetical protein